MFDFESNQTLTADQIGTVPSDFRPFYSEKPDAEGKFTLRSDDPVVSSAVRTISGLGKALGSERKITEKLKGTKIDLTPLAEFGATPEEIRTAIDTRLTEAKKGSGVNVEKIKEDLGKAYADRIKASDTRAETLQNQLHGLLVDNEVSKALAGKAATPKTVEMLMPYIRQNIRVVEEDGKVQVFVVDSAGDKKFSPTTGSPMTVGELVEAMSKDKDFAPFFASTTPAGMPGPGRTNQPAGRQTNPGELSAHEKIKAGLAAGLAGGMRR